MPLPTPGDLPDPGIETVSLASPALTGGFFTTRATWEALCVCVCVCVHTPSAFALWLPCPSGRVGDPSPPRSTDGGG